MRSLRIRFVWIGALLLGAVGLVIYRAEQTIESERVARHDAVAGRLFDEIETELSAFLEEAEGRDGVPNRSFVVAIFDLDPDGHFNIQPHPHRSSPVPRERIDHLERLTRSALAPRDAGEPHDAKRERNSQLRDPAQEPREDNAASALSQRAGSTQNLKAIGRIAEALEENDRAYSAYDALQSLNRSVERRALRKDRGLGSEPDSDGSFGPRSAPPRLDPSAPGATGAESASSAHGGAGFSPNRASSASTVVVIAENEEVPLADRREEGAVRARVLDAGHLLLFRTFVEEGRVTRQGLWLDAAQFFSWLERSALGATGVARVASLRFYGPFDGDAALPGGEFVYRHRFGEPFDELRAILALETLRGLRGATTTRALSALLFVAASLSLFALYRMVSLAFRFAERRSNFVAAVSHELKTPLTAIRMYAEMLCDDVVSDETQRRGYYTSIADESERLSRLIDNVLEFSKLEQGRHDLSLVVGSVEPVLREVERLLAAHVDRAGFELALEIEPELPPVRYNRDALIQVLFNLIDNALKYARDAAPRRVTLRCRASDAGVAISVRDCGPGLAAGELRKVFEPFYRSGQELTRRARGSGIGLSLVRSLGEAMGATVHAENAQPAGLCVSLTLRPVR